MFEEISLVRLIPTDLTSRHSTDVQAIYIWRSDKAINQLIILGDSGDNKTWPQRVRNLIRRDFHNARKGKHKLPVSKFVFGVFTKNYSRQKIFTVLKVRKSFTPTKLCSDFPCARFSQSLIDK